MKLLIPFLLFPFLSEVTDGLKTVLLGRGQDLLSSLECEPQPQGYIVPDPHHCDRLALALRFSVPPLMSSPALSGLWFVD